MAAGGGLAIKRNKIAVVSVGFLDANKHQEAGSTAESGPFNRTAERTANRDPNRAAAFQVVIEIEEGEVEDEDEEWEVGVAM